MASTFYFEGEVPLGDMKAAAKYGKKGRKIELFVSDFFGTHELYLRIDDDEPGTVRLSKAQARELLVGLQGGMSYLGY
jgi:hypothetical protein